MRAPGGRNSVAECQLPKLDVAGSNPVARSRSRGPCGFPAGPFVHISTAIHRGRRQTVAKVFSGKTFQGSTGASARRRVGFFYGHDRRPVLQRPGAIADRPTPLVLGDRRCQRRPRGQQLAERMGGLSLARRGAPACVAGARAAVTNRASGCGSQAAVRPRRAGASRWRWARATTSCSRRWSSATDVTARRRHSGHSPRGSTVAAFRLTPRLGRARASTGAGSRPLRSSGTSSGCRPVGPGAPAVRNAGAEPRLPPRTGSRR